MNGRPRNDAGSAGTAGRAPFLTEAALVLSLAGAILTIEGAHGGVAACLILAAAVLGCGWAVTGWIRGMETTYALALCLGTGVAIWIVTALLCLETGLFAPRPVVSTVLVAAVASNLALAGRSDRGVGPR